jgi:hypothetical protein
MHAGFLTLPLWQRRVDFVPTPREDMAEVPCEKRRLAPSRTLDNALRFRVNEARMAVIYRRNKIKTVFDIFRRCKNLGYVIGESVCTYILHRP